MNFLNKENAGESRQLLEFSPPKSIDRMMTKSTDQNIFRVPTLVCAKFQESLRIEFGYVRVGSTSTKKIQLINPSKTESINVAVDRVPNKFGVSIVLESLEGETSVTLEPSCTVGATVFWIPLADMTVREIALLKMNGKAPLQIIVHGLAGEGTVDKQTSSKRPLLPHRKEMLPTRVTKPSVPCAAAIVAKPTAKKATELRDSPQYKDILTDWINSKLNTQCDESETYVAARKAMSHLLDSEAVRDRLSATFRQVDDGVLAVRHDRNIIADLGLQQAIVDIMFSYELSWLRVALEAVSKTHIRMPARRSPSEDLQPRIKHVLKNFLISSLMGINQTSSHNLMHLSVVNTEQEKKVKDQINKNFIKKTLELFLLLDVARMQNITPQSRLFRQDSTVKCTKEVLGLFCRTFMASEGDFVQHLAAIGYCTSFQQTFVHEYDFTLKDLSLDLRDGVRLARLVEVLSQSYDLTSSLRFPAVSRLQKIHNVGLAINCLAEIKVLEFSSSQIASTSISTITKAIVDGDTEQTQWLIWQMMYQCDLKLFVDADSVTRECRCLCSDYTTRNPAPSVQDSLLDWSNLVLQSYGVTIADATVDFADGRLLSYILHKYFPQHVKLDSTSPAVAASTVPMKGRNEESKYMLVLRRALKSVGGIPVHFTTMQPKLKTVKYVTLFLGYIFARVQKSLKEKRAIDLISSSILKHLKVLKQKLLRKRRRLSTHSTAPRRLSAGVVCNVPVNVSLSRLQAAKIIQCVYRSQKLKLKLNKAVLSTVREDVVETLPEPLLDCNSFESETAQHATEIETECENVVIEVAQAAEQSAVQSIEVEEKVVVNAIAFTEDIDIIDVLTPEVVVEPISTETVMESPSAKFRVELERQLSEMRLLSAKETEEKINELQQRYELSLRQEREAREEAERQVSVEHRGRLQAETLVSEIERARQEAAEQAVCEHRARTRSATLMQRLWRRKHAMQFFFRAKAAIVKIQSVCRTVPVARRYRSVLLSIGILQAMWRRKQCVQLLASMSRSCVVCQRAYRGWRGRRLSQSFRLAVTKIQQWARRSVRRLMEVKLASAHKIQSCWFSYQHKMLKCRREKGARRIQAWVRMEITKNKFIAMKEEQMRESQLESNRRLKLFVSFSRLCLFLKASLNRRRSAKSTAVIARFWRSRIPRIRARKLYRGFRKLQAVCRAIACRHHRTEPEIKACNRIAVANAIAKRHPERSLYNKSVVALQVIASGLSNKPLEVPAACAFLKFATKLSPECSRLILSSNNGNELFHLIRSCNRTDSHQQLICIALKTLLHMSRSSTFAASIAQATDSTDTMVDLLQLFRDKKSVFCLCCELLSRLINANASTKEICNRQDYKKRLEGIFHILDRKHRLETRIQSITTKKMTDASFCGSMESAEVSFCGAQDLTGQAVSMMKRLLTLLQ